MPVSYEQNQETRILIVKYFQQDAVVDSVKRLTRVAFVMLCFIDFSRALKWNWGSMLADKRLLNFWDQLD